MVCILFSFWHAGTRTLGCENLKYLTKFRLSSFISHHNFQFCTTGAESHLKKFLFEENKRNLKASYRLEKQFKSTNHQHNYLHIVPCRMFYYVLVSTICYIW